MVTIDLSICRKLHMCCYKVKIYVLTADNAKMF